MPVYISPRATKLTTRQAGSLLDLSSPTIIKYIKLGLIPAEKNSSGSWMLDKKFIFDLRNECGYDLGHKKWRAGRALAVLNRK